MLGKGSEVGENHQKMQEETMEVATSPIRTREPEGYVISTPTGGDDSLMNEEEVLEERGELKTDLRVGTPERKPAIKRNAETEDDAMGEEIKVRRMNDDEAMDSIKKKAAEMEEAKIIKAVILGVDITEMYSPVRIAGIAAKYGLVQGTSFDLTNG